VSRLRHATAAASARVRSADAGREEVRVLAERDRARAASDRQDAADDREVAADDREVAADDREAATRGRGLARRGRTEHEAAARRALATLESMSDAFFTLDSEWRFTYLNPQTEAILERPRDELLGTSMWDEFPDGVGSQFENHYRRAVRDQVPVRFEGPYEPLGRTIEVRAFPVADGLAVYFTDVTNDRLLDARRRQTERLEAIGRVTAGVAHDFNNLLTAVRGFAQLGEAASEDETTTSYFAAIDSAGDQARQLTRQLLAFAREQALSPVVVDLNQVVEGLATVLRQLVPARITVDIVLAPDPVWVFVDRSQLEQVVSNLVMNGRDAIETSGTITITTMSDGPVAVAHDVRVASGWLQVGDTGSGIPDDAVPHIFEPFFSTKPRETSTGLGLATIYGIIRQSGGSIFVDTTPGVGTTMTLALPACQQRG
jgi:signal transduction histidine kinase